MLLKVDKFEELAKSKGYRNGYELSRDLGCGKRTYKLLKSGNRIGCDIVVEIFNRFGDDVAFDVIDFEEGTLNGFANKYIRIGNKLY